MKTTTENKYLVYGKKIKNNSANEYSLLGEISAINEKEAMREAEEIFGGYLAATESLFVMNKTKEEKNVF